MNQKILISLLICIIFKFQLCYSQTHDSLRNTIVKLLPPAGKYDESWLENDSTRYVMKNGKYGMLNKSFKEIVPCIYDNITVNNKSGFIELFKDGKYGLANSIGKIILECIYDEIQLYDLYIHFPDDAIHVTLNGKKGRVSHTGTVVTPIQYDGLLLINSKYIAVNKGDKYGLIDHNNNEILPSIYDKIAESAYEKYIIVYNNEDGYGIVNSTRTVILPCMYNKIEEWGVTEGLFIVQLGSSYGLIDSVNNLLLPFVYDDIQLLGSNNSINYYRVKKGDFYGVVDVNNKLIADHKYNDVKLLENGIIAIKDTGSDKWGCQNLAGKPIIHCKYDNVQNAANGWICVQIYDKWGCIDTSNKIIIPIIYSKPFHSENGLITTQTEADVTLFFDATGNQIKPKQSVGKYKEIGSFVNGVAVVTDASGNEGLINKKGELLLNCECETITEINHGVAWCIKDGKYVLIDKTGLKKVEVSLNDATDFYEGLSLVRNNNGYGFVDTAGRYKVLCIYEDGTVFMNGYASMKKDGKWGLIDKTGRVVIDFKYDNQFFYVEGLLGVKENNKCFYIDIKGNKKIAVKGGVIDLSPFQNGLAKVSDSNYYGYIDKTGKVVVPISFQYVTNFREGKAIYMESVDSKERSIDKFGLIDKSGRKITKAIYDWIAIDDSTDMTAVSHTYGCGLIGSNGEVLAPCIYEDISLSNKSSGICSAKLNGKWGYLNKQGKTIIPHKFDSGGEFSEGVAVVKYQGKWVSINTKGNILVQLGEVE